MTRVVLHEHGRLVPHGGRLDGAVVDRRAYERLRRFDERVAHDDGGVFTWYAHHAKASQWVGVVQVDGLQVEILPKIEAPSADDVGHVSRMNLLAMLAMAGNLPVRSRELASLAERKASLSEVLARLFAEKLVAELLRGPERRYRSRRENLHGFKGKLVVARQVLRNAAHRERFVCDYDELVTDTPMNRVFRAACRQLVLAARVPRTVDALRRALSLLDEVEDEVVTPELLQRVPIDRKNERFESLFAFCRLLFAHESPTARAGATNTFSLLFDMNVVFEQFITAFVRRHVLPQLPGWSLFPQAHGRHRHLLSRAGRGVLRLAPDLLLETPDGDLVVVDTKWKHLARGGKQRRASRSDLYQLYAYLQRFEADRTVLLYPRVPHVDPDVLEVFEQGDEPGTKRVEVRFTDVSVDLASETGRAALGEELRRLLQPLDRRVTETSAEQCQPATG